MLDPKGWTARVGSKITTEVALEAGTAELRESVDEPRWGLRFILFFLFVFALFVLRRPDSLLNPQFWAEDGTLLFQDQLLQNGLAPVLHGYRGYLIVNTRLMTAFAALFPILYAPLVFNVIAIAIAALGCSLFVLPWYRHLVRSDALRAVTCVAAAGALSTQSLVDNLSNSQWYMALAALILLVRADVFRKQPAISLIGLLAGFSLLAALTNPVMIVAVPICIWNLARRCNASISIAVLAGVIAQITYSFLAPAAGGVHILIPWTVLQIDHLVASAVTAVVYKVVLVSLAGSRAVYLISEKKEVGAFLCILIGTVAWLAWLFVSLDRRKRLQAGAALLVGISSILLPLVARSNLSNTFDSVTQIPDRGEQYFFIAGCVLLFLMALSIERALSSFSGSIQALALVMVIASGLVTNFKVPPFVDLHWRQSAAEIVEWRAAREHHLFQWGVTVPLNPDSWGIHLPSSREFTLTGFPDNIAAGASVDTAPLLIQGVTTNSATDYTYIELPPVLETNTLYRVRAVVRTSGRATVSLLVHGKTAGGARSESEPRTITNDFNTFETRIKTDESARLCIHVKHYSGAAARFQSITVTRL